MGVMLSVPNKPEKSMLTATARANALCEAQLNWEQRQQHVPAKQLDAVRSYNGARPFAGGQEVATMGRFLRLSVRAHEQGVALYNVRGGLNPTFNNAALRSSFAGNGSRLPTYAETASPPPLYVPHSN